MELSIIVIVSRSHAEGTGRTLQSLAGLDAEWLVYDTTDNHYDDAFLQEHPVRLYKAPWEGYELVRFRAAILARYDWVLMLHAGEQLDERFKRSLRQFDYQSRQQAYRVRFKNLLGNTWLCHGEWGGYYHIRFANRCCVRIGDQRVTEAVFAQQQVPVGKLRGHILYCSIKDRQELERKISGDAGLQAEKYFREGRSIYWLRSRLSPVAAFLQAYFLKLGFLDGRTGYFCARMGARYTKLKYARLREMKKSVRMQP